MRVAAFARKRHGMGSSGRRAVTLFIYLRIAVRQAAVPAGRAIYLYFLAFGRVPFTQKGWDRQLR